MKTDVNVLFDLSSPRSRSGTISRLSACPSGDKLGTRGEKTMRQDTPLFVRFANTASRWAGSPAVFASALALVVAWAACGPLFDYSQTWQLVINTSTTIITFLMVFLIQNTQNRDSGAVQIKLDELIRSHEGARTELLDLEELSDEHIRKLRDMYQGLAEKARQRLDRTGTPELG